MSQPYERESKLDEVTISIPSIDTQSVTSSPKEQIPENSSTYFSINFKMYIYIQHNILFLILYMRSYINR